MLPVGSLAPLSSKSPSPPIPPVAADRHWALTRHCPVLGELGWLPKVTQQQTAEWVSPASRSSPCGPTQETSGSPEETPQMPVGPGLSFQRRLLGAGVGAHAGPL